MNKLAFLFFALTWTVAVNAENLVMPKELTDFAKENDCSQITDFFERPGMIGPPYAYGYLPGEEENSAVFWCKKEQNGDKPYLLLFMTKDSEHSIGCPTKIEWWNPPRGLSIYKAKNLPLRDFQYVRDPKKKGPANAKATGNLVLSSYDGVSEFFYCYQGDWLFTIKH